MTVLVVDDSSDKGFIEGILKTQNFMDIVSVSSVSEALCFMNVDKPTLYLDNINLILMNLAMYEDNLVVCEMICAIECYQDIPVIMAVDEVEAERLQEALFAGAVDFITRPIKKAELIARVMWTLKLKKDIQEIRARESELLQQIDDMERINEKLQEMSFIDGLTCIANRRRFDEVFPREWRRARRDKTPISVLIIDIDYFKNYNDVYGHPAGDTCLKRIAGLMETVLKRPSDLVARYGGEEFVIVLHSTDLNGGLTVAERIREAVEELGVPHEGSSVSKFVTVSIGVASDIPVGKTPYSLISRADEALYLAKRGGRNQVVISTSGNLKN